MNFPVTNANADIILLQLLFLDAYDIILNCHFNTMSAEYILFSNFLSICHAFHIYFLCILILASSD